MIATFKRVAALSNNLLLVQSAIARSTELEIQGDLMRRRTDWQKWIPPSARPHGRPPQLSEAAIALQQAASAMSLNSPPQLQSQQPPLSSPLPSNQAQASRDTSQSQASARVASDPVESQTNGHNSKSSDEASTIGVSPLQSNITSKVAPASPRGKHL